MKRGTGETRYLYGRLAARTLFAACWALLVLPRPLSAGGAGATSVQILKSDISPRAMSMGGSFAAVADDVYASQYNPAGLGQLSALSASAMYYSGFEDSRLQYLAVGAPAPLHGLAGLDGPVVTVSALFTQNGDFTPRTLNPDDTVSVGNTVSAETNRVLALSYGEKVYSGPLNLNRYRGTLEHYLGFALKYVHSSLLEEYSASALAVDAGWLVKEPRLGLAFALSLSNYGSSLKYLRDGNRLSSTARAGLAWKRGVVRDHTLLLTHEYDSYTGEGLVSMRSGLEYDFEKIFSFRLGYKGCSALGLFTMKSCDSKEGNGGTTMGLGARHEGFSVDLGFSLGNEVFNNTQVALSYRFSGLKPAGRAERTRSFEAIKPLGAAKKKTERKKVRKTRPAERRKTPSGADDSGLYWVD